jgi:3-oxoacyl-[acyl-carrier-protein] synthase-1
MRRVVVTGMGIVSSIGNNSQEVARSLRAGKSGIEFVKEYEELGFRSRVAGTVNIDIEELIDRKLRRFMGNSAAYNYIAMQEAVNDSGLAEDQVSNTRTGLIAGSGGASTENVSQAIDLLREKGIRRVGPYMVPRTMSSTNSACLATPFKIHGVNYSISSACSTSAHCIGNGYELIQYGKQDFVFAGGGEELHWTLTLMFDAMGALSSKYNDTPETASRPYDATRDGFVIAGGGGMVDYINAHGTSTPVGDMRELEAVRAVYGDNVPAISSTKSLSGHSLGAAGVHEAIFSLLMMQENFISASANITEPDPLGAEFPIVRELTENAGLNTIMSNSFGFGGTNATLVFQRLQED